MDQDNPFSLMEENNKDKKEEERSLDLKGQFIFILN